MYVMLLCKLMTLSFLGHLILFDFINLSNIYWVPTIHQDSELGSGFTAVNKMQSLPSWTLYNFGYL